MDKLPNTEYWNVTHVTETCETDYAEKLLGLGWKLITAGTRYCDGDNVPTLVLGWADTTEPPYPQTSSSYPHLGQCRK